MITLASSEFLYESGIYSSVFRVHCQCFKSIEPFIQVNRNGKSGYTCKGWQVESLEPDVFATFFRTQQDLFLCLTPEMGDCSWKMFGSLGGT